MEHLHRYCASISFLNYPIQLLHPLLANSLSETYTSWTGLQGGYAFYSPTVGNGYEIQFRQQLTNHKDTTAATLFQAATGLMRYQSFLDIGVSFVYTDRRDEQQTAIAMIKQAREIYRVYHPDASICVTLASYISPSLSQLKTHLLSQPFYLSLYTYNDTIALSDE